MLEQIFLIVLLLFVVKAASWFFDNSKEETLKPEPIPDDESDFVIRKFNWTVEDNIKSHLLNCDVKINLDTFNKAKEELISDFQPSKIFFTCNKEYFTISKYQILHKTFGSESKEIEVITNYLREYADNNFLSNYRLANLILSFVHEQNIKYSFDEDSTGYDEYLRFPIETLYDQTGDCDCKSILVASLFKKLGFKVALALLPGHAALAISMESSPFFANFEWNGIPWYYCESTGDYWKPGQLPRSVDIGDLELSEI